MRRAASLRRVMNFAGVAAGLLAGTAVAGNAYDYCVLCHGANANGNYGIRAPKISGVEPWYLTRQLQNFASGARGMEMGDASGHEMMPVGQRLQTAGEIEAAVNFVSGLESKKPPRTIAGDIKAGKALYASCAACHGAKGEGNATLQAPALAARSDWYLVTQLGNFRNGLRGADARDTYGAQMRAVAATLPDDKAISDVVAYIDTL